MVRLMLASGFAVLLVLTASPPSMSEADVSQRDTRAVQAPGGFFDRAFRYIDAGGLAVCGVSASGKVACAELQGYVGDPPKSRNGPFTQVSYGGDAVCALRVSGRAVCWDGYRAPSNRDRRTIRKGRGHRGRRNPRRLDRRMWWQRRWRRDADAEVVLVRGAERGVRLGREAL